MKRLASLFALTLLLNACASSLKQEVIATVEIEFPQEMTADGSQLPQAVVVINESQLPYESLYTLKYFLAMPEILNPSPEEVLVLEKCHNELKVIIANWFQIENEQVLIGWEDRSHSSEQNMITAFKKERHEDDSRFEKMKYEDIIRLEKKINKMFEQWGETLCESLEPDRRNEWEGYEVSQGFIDFLWFMTIDADQETKIRRAGVEFIRQARQANEPNPKVAALNELEKWVVNNVMDKAQKEKYQEGIQLLDIIDCPEDSF